MEKCDTCDLTLDRAFGCRFRISAEQEAAGVWDCFPADKNRMERAASGGQEAELGVCRREVVLFQETPAPVGASAQSLVSSEINPQQNLRRV